MTGPGDSSLALSRRWIIICTALAAGVTAITTAQAGLVASAWSNATGCLLGGLAGTYVGEQLMRFAQRTEATGIVWLQMAALALLLTGAVVWNALPAYCQLPVGFAMGLVIGAAIVYIQRLNIR